jgi:8-oxo-dGTP pyrophosphatase MutT (NUDIX family)
VLLRGGRVLLARRYQTGYEDGNYSLPAGHLDAEETCLQAMQREAQEEIKLELKTEQLRFAHLMHRNDGGRPSLDLFFVCEEWGGEPSIGEPHKCDELRWCAIDRLPTNTIPYIRQALTEISRNSQFSTKGFA